MKASLLTWLRTKRAGHPGGQLPAPHQERAAGGSIPACRPPAVARPAPAVLPKTILLIMMEGSEGGPLATALATAGYAVLTVLGLPCALESLTQEPPGLVLTSGLCRPGAYLALRAATRAPILALVPQTSEDEVIAALNAGVDDCQPATIGADEAVMRVRALLRRDGLPNL